MGEKKKMKSDMKKHKMPDGHMMSDKEMKAQKKKMIGY